VEGIEVEELPLRGEVAPRALLPLARRLRYGSWDLIHAHTPHAVTLGALARTLGARLPLVAHRRVDFPFRRNPCSLLKRHWPQLWIAVSEAVRGQLLRDGVDPSRITVVPSALDPERAQARRRRSVVRRELGVSEDELAIGTVGALAEHKGQAVLLEAFARVAGTLPRCRLLLIGSGRLAGELARRAEELGVDDVVVFLGQRDDVPELLGALDVFVFPSLSGEGSPASLKEALASGVPTLATSIPAHRELGLPETCLAPPGDAEMLASRLRETIGDPLGARRRAERCRTLVDRYTPEALVEQTLSAYGMLTLRAVP
jgi:glycosyltransferase involved in cell wall biosynthesis